MQWNAVASMEPRLPVRRRRFPFPARYPCAGLQLNSFRSEDAKEGG